MNVDFIRIGQHTVRVTSLKEDATTGALSLVVIARGTVDRRRLADLLATSPVMVDVADRPSRLMDVVSTDERVVGTEEQAITRFATELLPSSAPLPGDSGAADDTLPARLDRIEASLEEILRILQNR